MHFLPQTFAKLSFEKILFLYLKFDQNKNFLAVFFTAIGNAFVYVVTHRDTMKPNAESESGPVQQGTSKSTNKLALVSIGL